MNRKQDDVRRLEADIAVIKDAIRANNGFIRRILAAPVLGWFFAAFGMACAVVMLVWEFALRQFDGTAGMPTWGMVLLGGATVAVFAVLAIWKIAALNRGARAVDHRYSWYDVLLDLMGHPVLLYQPLVMAGTVFAAVMAVRSGSGYLVPAAVAAGLAIVFMLYAVAFLLNEYSFIIVWLSLFAAAVLLLPTVPPLIMSAIGFGGGFLLFGVFCVAISRRPLSDATAASDGTRKADGDAQA
ncbi:MAG: hypothetical protein ACOC0D_08265 [Spirochaeta sp.]